MVRLPASGKGFLRILASLLAVVMLFEFALVIVRPTPARAFPGEALAAAIWKEIRDQIRSIRTDIKEKIGKSLKISADIAFKNSLRVFVGKLAEDTATWVASAGTGQKPLFVTDPHYFTKLRDAAAGEFIDSFAKDYIGTSICQPVEIQTRLSLLRNVQHLTLENPLDACGNACRDEEQARQNNIAQAQEFLKIAQLALEKTPTRTDYPCEVLLLPTTRAIPTASDYIYSAEPKTPMKVSECVQILGTAVNKEKSASAKQSSQCLQQCKLGTKKASCSVQTAWQNLSSAKVAAQVNVYFSPTENQIAQLVQLHDKVIAEGGTKAQEEKDKLTFDFKPTETKVSGEKTAPGKLVEIKAGQPINESTAAEKTYTGSLAADAVRIFTNTLTQKLTDRFFKSKCGLNPSACKGPSQGKSGEGGSPLGTSLIQLNNVAAAQLQFSTLGQTEYIAGDATQQLDVFEVLQRRGVKVDSRLAQAISEKKTVKEALDLGLLDGAKTFGFDVGGNEPQDGYPYRLIVYLRHYRVVPVGWELAAEYIQKFDNRNIGLSELIKKFNLCGQRDANGNQVELSPYCGLIDPNWVLKLPSTYCRRQGAGEEIVSRQFTCDEDNNRANNKTDNNGNEIPVVSCTGSDPDIGKWNIVRNTDYCTDEQSCIAENDDGTCKQFGYCYAEKSVWRFNGTSCPNYYASCTAFTSNSGKEVAYLTNTVDSPNCNAEVAGCRWYCQSALACVGGGNDAKSCNVDLDCPGGACQQRLDTCKIDSSTNTIYFDRDAKACSESANGCTQYLRTTNGANVAANGSFETVNGTVDDGVFDEIPGWFGGGNAMTSDNALTGIKNHVAVMLGGLGLRTSPPFDSLNQLSDRPFTLSYYARTIGQNCIGIASITVGGVPTSADERYGMGWERYQIVGAPPTGAGPHPTTVEVSINFANEVDADEKVIGPCKLLLDNVQLEEGASATTYKDYGESSVYMNSSRRSCTAEEIGCELYAPVGGGLKVPGIVTPSDRCSADAVGCKALRELPTPPQHIPARDGQDPIYLIPKTGRRCTAAAVGCEEYTNLNKQSQGGEAREYYSQIKQCVLPKAGDPDQQTFYTWTGSETRGFQLKSYLMFLSNWPDPDAGGAKGPCTNLKVAKLGEDPICVDEGADTPVAKCSTADMVINPDCTEFFDADGRVFYRYRSRTINVADECFPARNSIDQQSTDADVRKNIYMIAPSESASCPASYAGCREYEGNAGNNVRTLVNETFEQGSAAGWEVGAGGGVSTESVGANGHSLKVPQPTARMLPALIADKLTEGKTYTLSFWAKANDVGAKLRQIYFDDADGVGPEVRFLTSDGPILSTDWNRYAVGPVTIDRPVRPDEGVFLIIDNAPGDVFLDNVQLQELTDSVYLIHNSAKLCASQDANCEAWKDRQSQTRYLKHFSRLCSEKVVGCEELIDTKNSSRPDQFTFKNVTVPADSFTSLVVDRKSFCNAADKGCTAYGDPLISLDDKGLDIVSSWKTTYLRNDPDLYESILCTAKEDRCTEYVSKVDSNKFYFRDPGDHTCSYERPPNEDEFRWVLTGTAVACPTNANPSKLVDVCEPRDIGGVTEFCYRSSPDDVCIPCVTRTCDAKESGCNEYRDPSDPPDCRIECPLEMTNGQPQPVDSHCRAEEVSKGAYPGCRSYTYLKQSVEGTAAECGTQINQAEGCRPFYDTSSPSRNFRGG